MIPNTLALPANFLSRIAKDAQALQSFVIDEIALTELLERSWRPIGRKIISMLSPAIDFTRSRYHAKNGLNVSMWLTEDMFDEELSVIWSKIETQARKLLARAYDRGIEEEGKDPFGTEKSQRVSKSVSGVYAERKAQAISILLGMVQQQFTGYARETAIPAVKETLSGLGRIESIARELDAQAATQLDRDAAEIARFELLRKMRVAAQDKARAELIERLRDLAANCQAAAGAANMSTSRAHHFGFLDWASENGIEYYRISATLDSKTCVACARMDGKVFALKDAMAFRDKFLAAAGDKDKLKQDTPFLTKKDVASVRGIDLKSLVSAASAIPA